MYSYFQIKLADRDRQCPQFQRFCALTWRGLYSNNRPVELCVSFTTHFVVFDAREGKAEWQVCHPRQKKCCHMATPRPKPVKLAELLCCGFTIF
jgi:hypothetical protein